ncbi:TetR/AcrR family transcriptional regulator [Eubacterium oxidoreducens]|uniref:Transcriptional regulator, TetR family n=1 Tax=Eubacterium oxidoreducens TaxID=1732 RepID=A0A1G6BMY5_EUBOX|nr:TetR/AcrR family transcriptional regulator [Eubacterium oxidoreducens]SDB21945.1 transcriptional regulator, TetR family [Eubacterium oxidoreducens]
MTKKSMDKRAVRSRLNIKDTFIDLMQNEKYGNITVTSICNEAQISRSTFYQHYRGIPEVLDEVLKDVFAHVSSFRKSADIKQDTSKSAMPLCEFIRQNPKYQNILTNPELLNQVVNQFLAIEVRPKLGKLEQQMHMSRMQIEAIYVFRFTGCLNVIRQNMNKTDNEWQKIRQAIDQNIASGLVCE